MKRLIPDYYAQNIYSIPYDFYLSHNFKVVVCDLDNTLDSYRCMIPTKRAIDYVSKLKELGIKVVVLSNNHEKRVKPYAGVLEIEYMYESGKPFGRKIRNFLVSRNINLDEVIMIGDQLMTDVKAAKRVGVKVCLTEKLVKEDQWTTHFNRIFDNVFRKRMHKLGILKGREIK